MVSWRILRVKQFSKDKAAWCGVVCVSMLNASSTKKKQGHAKIMERLDEESRDILQAKDPFKELRPTFDQINKSEEEMFNSYSPEKATKAYEILKNPNYVITIRALASALHVNIGVFYKWMDKFPAFREAVLQGRQWQENNLANILVAGKYAQGTMFALKNMFNEHWKDKYETETTISLANAIDQTESAQRPVQWIDLEQPKKLLQAQEEEEEDD